MSQARSQESEVRSQPPVRVLLGDVLARLRDLPSESVHCVITSPPYWGLRDYGVDGQLGLEATPQAYVAKMVQVFAEVHRVLRDDGTLWLNLGDSYATGAGKVKDCPGGGKQGRAFRDKYWGAIGLPQMTQPNRLPIEGLKRKELIGIPWRVAFALQEAGWYLRSDIIWAKSNSMPESVNDRPTNCHEHVFLLAKSEDYFYDAFAIREAASGTAHARGNGVHPKAFGANSRVRVNRDVAHAMESPKIKANRSFSAAVRGLVAHRNKRNVWTIGAKAYRGAHFATFPPALVEPCMLAGSSAHGVCCHCGAPFQRVVEKGEANLAYQRASGGDANGEYHGHARKDFAAHGAQNGSAVKARILAGMVEKVTTGWRQTCHCLLSKPVPATVLDPFGGSGTVGEVARAHGRGAVLVELNPEYLPLIQGRCGEVELC